VFVEGEEAAHEDEHHVGAEVDEILGENEHTHAYLASDGDGVARIEEAVFARSARRDEPPVD